MATPETGMSVQNGGVYLNVKVETVVGLSVRERERSLLKLGRGCRRAQGNRKGSQSGREEAGGAPGDLPLNPGPCCLLVRSRSRSRSCHSGLQAQLSGTSAERGSEAGAGQCCERAGQGRALPRRAGWGRGWFACAAAMKSLLQNSSGVRPCPALAL